MCNKFAEIECYVLCVCVCSVSNNKKDVYDSNDDSKNGILAT